MPGGRRVFHSRSQVRTCFTTRPKGWNCEKMLKDTSHPEALPERSGGHPHRKSSRGKHSVGPLRKGSRGGKYRMIGGIKVYFSRKTPRASVAERITSRKKSSKKKKIFS